MSSAASDVKQGSVLSDLKRMFGGSTSGIRQLGMVLVLAVLLIGFNISTDGLTLSPGNLQAIVYQYSYILILAIGMVMVIIAGHIDLSVGSVAAFSGICVAKAMDSWDLPWPLAILLGLGIGALIGVWQGFWVAYVGVPAFIVTLAGMLLFRGGNQFVGDSTSVPVPDGFTKIGDGFLPEFGPDTGYNNWTLIIGIAIAIAIAIREWRLRTVQKAMRAQMAPVWVSVVKVVLLVAITLYFTRQFASGRAGTSFPVSGLILLGLFLVYSFVTKSTIFGRHIYAVGGNSHAAQLSGVKTRRVNFLVMVNMSVLAALAGMIFVARSHASGPADGNGWELDAIAAVFIGGAAVSGGVGTVLGSIVGGLVMAVLSNGLVLESVTSDKVQIIRGLVLLLAVAFDVYSKKQGKPSITGLLFRDRSAPPTSPPAEGLAPTSDVDTNRPTSVTTN